MRAWPVLLRDGAMAQGCHSVLHLAGRLVSEGHDQDITRPHDARREPVRHATRDDTRLAAARAGEDAQRAGGDRHGLALGRIQIGQQVVGVGERHPVIVAVSAYSTVIG